jgi:hypothetical protein
MAFNERAWEGAANKFGGHDCIEFVVLSMRPDFRFVGHYAFRAPLGVHVSPSIFSHLKSAWQAGR